MENKALYAPFELHVSDMDCWEQRPLVYHFFEIVRILDGEGTRIVNRNRFPYKAGSIFLFTPQDCRGFDIQQTTRFCSIRFSEVFLGQCKNTQDQEKIGSWLKQLEHIFFHHNRFEPLLVKHPGDCGQIAALMQNMVDEYQQKRAYHEQNLQHLVTLVLNILARNVSDTPETAPAQDPLINRMMLHLRQHIQSPEKLKVEYLAAQFNLSANYVGEYFRKFTGESLQHYIMQYRLQLVQHKLSYSAQTIAQIADELGFTDESHLSRQFRKHKGLSPLAFRKSLKTSDQRAD